jgi:hypothetical protein
MGVNYWYASGCRTFDVRPREAGGQIYLGSDQASSAAGTESRLTGKAAAALNELCKLGRPGLRQRRD